MTILKIYDSDDNLVCTLTQGEHYIGRETLNCDNDKTISRRHALMKIKDNGAILKCEHLNSFQFKSSDGEVSKLKLNDEKPLRTNDKFRLSSQNDHWFKIEVINNDKRPCEGSNDGFPCKKLKTENTPNNNNSTGDESSLDTPDQYSLMETQPSTSKLKSSPSKGKRVSFAGDDIDNFLSFCDGLTDDKNTTKTLDKKVPENNDNPALNETANDSLNEPVNEPSNDFVNQQVNEPSKEPVNESLKESSNEPQPGTSSAVDGEVKVKVEVKKEKDDDAGNVMKIEIENEIKKEKDDDGADKASNEADKTSNEAGKASNEADKASNEADKASSGPSVRRERCWYGASCYRRNPQHKQDFSHPTDDDWATDPEDDRSDCPFGVNCYSTNKNHRQQFKHFSKPAKKPPTAQGGTASSGDESENSASPGGKVKKVRKKASSGDESENSASPAGKVKKVRKKVNYKESPEDDYDFDDSFINDGSSDEYVVSDDDDDSDWEESQETPMDSQETRDLVKEAKKFTRKKKKK